MEAKGTTQPVVDHVIASMRFTRHRGTEESVLISEVSLISGVKYGIWDSLVYWCAD